MSAQLSSLIVTALLCFDRLKVQKFSIVQLYDFTTRSKSYDFFFIPGAECIPCDNLVFDENEDYTGCDVINSPGSNETELGIRDLIGKYLLYNLSFFSAQR